MKCPSEKKIIEFYYNEIPKKERTLLGKHIEECSKCSKYYNEVKQIMLILKNRETEKLNYSEYIVELRKKIDNAKTTVEYKKRFSVSRLTIATVWTILLLIGVYNYMLHN